MFAVLVIYPNLKHSVKADFEEKKKKENQEEENVEHNKSCS